MPRYKVGDLRVAHPGASRGRHRALCLRRPDNAGRRRRRRPHPSAHAMRIARAPHSPPLALAAAGAPADGETGAKPAIHPSRSTMSGGTGGPARCQPARDRRARPLRLVVPRSASVSPESECLSARSAALPSSTSCVPALPRTCSNGFEGEGCSDGVLLRAAEIEVVEERWRVLPSAAALHQNRRFPGRLAAALWCRRPTATVAALAFDEPASRRARRISRAKKKWEGTCGGRRAHPCGHPQPLQVAVPVRVCCDCCPMRGNVPRAWQMLRVDELKQFGP